MTENAAPHLAHLAGRPHAGGLVVPWITPHLNGQYLFGTLTDLTQRHCLRQYRCQVCGQRLPERAVLFARTSDLDWMCTPEPATCPPCAWYSTRACPMLSGRIRQYRASQHPAVAGIPLPGSEALRLGASAESWYAVWVAWFDIIDHPAKPDTLAASWKRIPPLRIRPVPIDG
jgi:hypothetical protein